MQSKYNYNSKYSVDPNTSRERKAETAALDTGLEYAQTGASIGSSVGALVGTIIAPGVGTAIGGVVGTAGGAIIGGGIGAVEGALGADDKQREYDEFMRNKNAYERSIFKDMSNQSLSGYPTSGIINSDL